MRRQKVSVTKAIKAGKESVEMWKEAEWQGRADGISGECQLIVDELKDFRKDLKKNKGNEQYVCKTVSGYISALNNYLYHTRPVYTSDVNFSAEEMAKARERLNVVRKRLSALTYLLKGIDIEP